MGAYPAYTTTSKTFIKCSERSSNVNFKSNEIYLHWSLEEWIKYTSYRFKTRRIVTYGSIKTILEKWPIYEEKQEEKAKLWKITPLIHLGILLKHVATNISKYIKISIEQIMIPSEISPSLEVFIIHNLLIAVPNKFRTQEDENKYESYIQQAF